MAKFELSCLVVLASVGLISADCSLGVRERGVGGSDQKAIVDKHNAFRLQLAHGQVADQPKATNLLRMVYDARLAAEAQKIANTCNFAHVPVTDGRWSHVGQNLYIYKSTACTNGADWNSAIQSWFNEYTAYTYPSSASAGTGHYTQLVWATSKYVGCGYTFFNANGKYPCQKLYVCNYGPGGNIQGQPPYEVNGSGCENLC